jgi:hypothetical protein
VRSISRRDLARAALAGGATWVLPRPARAADHVPVRVQAELLVKVAAYDERLVARPGERQVLLFMSPGHVDGEAMAKLMRSELGAFARIAGKPHREELVRYQSPAALADACRKKDAAIAYLAPGLGASIAAIAAALNGIQVLTVAALPEYVERGTVLGFDLVSGKPKLLVHFEQARRQHVAFTPELLRLAKVYR